MLDTYNNGTIAPHTFIKFWKLSLLYLELDPNGLQRVSQEEI